LATKIGNALTTDGILKLGVMLDLDKSTVEKRIDYINQAIGIALKEQGFETQNQPILTTVNQFITLKKDEYQTVQVAAYFTNVEKQGELEDLLRAIVSKETVFADCLNAWIECVKSKGKIYGKVGDTCDFNEKEFTKLWVDFYKRFDTLKRGDRGEVTTNWKVIWLGKEGNSKEIQERGSEIFDLKHEKLNELKEFLAWFN
jgi:thiaminase